MSATHSVKSKFTQLAAAVAVVGGVAAASMSAQAAPIYTWNTTSGSGSGTNQLTFTTGSPSVTLKARGYWTAASSGTSAFGAGTLNIYSGGIGENNGLNDSTSPQHAVDNNGRKDFVLFEFGSNSYNPLSFKIGWHQTDSDMQFWISNSNVAGLNLTTACGGACTINGLAGLGFTALSSFNDVPDNTTKNFNTSLTGRYLLVAAKLADTDDYFKISQIVGTIPEPTSLAIFALGLTTLAGFGGAERRQATRA